MAMAREVDVGIDVELTDAPVYRFAHRFLTEQEFWIVASLPEAKRHSQLFKLWCTKEAILEAAGYGLSADPRSIQVLKSSDAQLACVPSVEWRARVWGVADTKFDDMTDVTLAWSLGSGVMEPSVVRPQTDLKIKAGFADW